eukprot:710681-Pelagomonas_calceolata.AAC.1
MTGMLYPYRYKDPPLTEPACVFLCQFTPAASPIRCVNTPPFTPGAQAQQMSGTSNHRAPVSWHLKPHMPPSAAPITFVLAAQP